MNSRAWQNLFTFGLGTLGRDMIYALISMYLIYYLTDILNLTDAVLWQVTAIIVAARVFDALNDPVMGLIVDNTRSRFGQFKPWMAVGAVLSGVFTVLLFTDFSASGASFVVLFAFLYVMWGISYTINDISYWSMLPTLSIRQKDREKIGSAARICANIGLFSVVVGIIPLTSALGNLTGSTQRGFFFFAVLVVVIMWMGQCVSLFGVKESKSVTRKKTSTNLRGLFRAIFKNDQLLFTALSMALFMIGYTTTTSFGLYYFKYVFGDEGMYALFALILGLSQLAALVVFPFLTMVCSRKRLYAGATALVAMGYVLFFLAPTHTMLFIGAAGILLFVGQAFIQLLMLMFLTDSVDYGHWKLGKRNDSITFSLQPFIYKIGGAVASGVVGGVAILSGITKAESAAEMTEEGILLIKSAMMIFPLVCIVTGYILYRRKYKIDEAAHEAIVKELRDRGEIGTEEEIME